MGRAKSKKTPPPPITESEFVKLTETLAAEIQRTNIDYRLYRDLSDACTSHAIVVQQSRVFWPMTLDAHLNSAVLRLCRIYDTHKSSFNLRKWLMLIKRNPAWFSESAFEARKSNPISTYHGSPDATQLESDIESASVNNPIVKNLVAFRGNMLAHLGENWALNRRNARAAFRLTLGDVETLAANALSILNRYMGLYDSQQYAATLLGGNDFDFVFARLRESIEQRSRSQG